MCSDQKKPKSYQHHRENQRLRILEAAERLFIRHGIDGVSITGIAHAARLTRKTFYEYFTNKQEVAWALLQKIFEQGQVASAVMLDGNGLQRIEHFMMQMVKQLETHPEQARFIVEFNSLYAREANANRMRQVAGQAWSGGYELYAQLIRQGIIDGSVRPDLDPELGSAAIWNLLSGMNNRFALLGGLISQEYGQPVMKIYLEICRTFLRGIQNTPSQENSE